MPGSSLWLVPPPSRPLYKILTTLIDTKLPAQFPSDSNSEKPPSFAPHLTLTSNIDPAVYGNDPQKWLDSIAWPSAEAVRVQFEGVETEDVFFRRCYIKAGLDGLREVAGIARARGVNGEETVGEKTEEWLKEWQESFGPHVSLMYGNTTLRDKLRDIERVVEEAPISFGPSTSLAQGGIKTNGWEGGAVWLVPTDKSIDEWKPIATKTLS